MTSTIYKVVYPAVRIQTLGTIGKLIDPFSPDGTLKCRFDIFLIFIWKGCPDAYERRDYEALAG